MSGENLPWWSRWLLWMSGVPAAPVASALPHLSQLVALSKKADPTVKKVLALYPEVKPLLDEGVPLVKALWGEWQEIAPAVNNLLESVQLQRRAGVDRVTAFNNVAKAARADTNRTLKLMGGHD